MLLYISCSISETSFSLWFFFFFSLSLSLSSAPVSMVMKSSEVSYAAPSISAPLSAQLGSAEISSSTLEHGSASPRLGPLSTRMGTNFDRALLKVSCVLECIWFYGLQWPNMKAIRACILFLFNITFKKLDESL